MVQSKFCGPVYECKAEDGAKYIKEWKVGLIIEYTFHKHKEAALIVLYVQEVVIHFIQKLTI